MFTLTDKTLIDRAARLLNEQAAALRNGYGQNGWSGDEESRKQKLVYDRLLRDERDLRALAKRLATHFGVKAAPRVVKTPPAEPTGNPESTPPPVDGTVAVLPAPVGEEVIDG